VTFRDALTATLADYDLGKLNDPSLKTSDIADAVLAMPEMQAVLDWLHDDWNRWCCVVCRADRLTELGIPDSVRAWVEGRAS
jgi:hypothetical protein